MKKVFFMAAIFAAMTFASCGNSQKPGTDGADSTADTTVVAGAEDEAGNGIESAMKEMAAQLDAKDATKFGTALESAQSKIQELVKSNPEAAKTYLEQLQTYLKSNAEQIKSVAGEKVATVATAISNAPATKIIETLTSTGTNTAGADAISKAAEAVSAVKNAPEDIKEAATKAVEKSKEDAKAKVEEKIEESKRKNVEKVEAGKKKANEAIDKGVNDLKGKLGL